MVELRRFATFHGPSPFSDDPVVVLELVGSGDDFAALSEALPALQSATADWYCPTQPSASADPSEVLGEFLADWALQALTHVRGYLHAAGCRRNDATGRVFVWVGFHDPVLSSEAVLLGARWLDALAVGRADAVDWSAALERIWGRCTELHPGVQTRIVMEAARRRGVPWTPAWGMAGVWQFGHGERSRVMASSGSGDDGGFGTQVARSKVATKGFLSSLGVPTPPFRLVSNAAEFEDAVAQVGFPCVTKPVNRGAGKGVTAGLTDLAAARQGFAAAREFTDGPVMVEAHVDGDDHRIMVVGGELAAVIRREPPAVTGDGSSTIGELIARQNAARDSRSLVRNGYLRPIRLDPSAQLHLSGLGLTPETVLERGRTVRVRGNANLATGGSCVDVTARVHPAVRTMAETVARTLNIATMAADLTTPDIMTSPAPGAGQFIEIDVTPSLDVMVAAGWPAERAGDLALGPVPGRVPVEMLIVRHDELDRAVAAARAGTWAPGSGWAAQGRAAHAGAELALDVRVPWAGVRALLAHRNLARAVVITSDLLISRDGLPLDRFAAVNLACELEPDWLRVVQGCCPDLRRGGRPDFGVWSQSNT